MKLNAILSKCLEMGDEKISSTFTEYTLHENDMDHKLVIYTKNCGKNRINDAVYTRSLDGCTIYEWSGTKDDLKIQ